MIEMKRPHGHLMNPALYTEAKRRWPGHVVTDRMLIDAATLADMPLYVEATNEAATKLGREMATETRRVEKAAADRRDLRNLGIPA